MSDYTIIQNAEDRGLIVKIDNQCYILYRDSSVGIIDPDTLIQTVPLKLNLNNFELAIDLACIYYKWIRGEPL